ncbi:MAG: hypothetical protein E6Q41_01530 [Cyclobacteriaceae bacterium]|nr:MAG: hypothetical protein E6Q41_01530 [Cyclobacteriaceae bacterium]
MESKRDDFTKPTIEILAKRVAYICSNPDCKRTTIGANEEVDKATNIGIAAHITAASEGGPRYDARLKEDQRKHIDNGIWLCSNCAALIDRDVKKFTVDLLNKWKSDAEAESRKKLNGGMITLPNGRPRLDVDLLLKSRGRMNRGYSEKNPYEIVNGHRVYNMPPNPIIFWGLFWNFNFLIFNNSSYPAFNLKIEDIGKEKFSQLDTIPNVNNLPPLMNLELNARLADLVEGDYLFAEKIVKSKVPDKFKNLKLKITYSDEGQNTYTDYFELTDSGIKKT